MKKNKNGIWKFFDGKNKLPSGTVSSFGLLNSSFGLLNNEDNYIKFYIDKEISDQEIMTFHPNTNKKLYL